MKVLRFSIVLLLLLSIISLAQCDDGCVPQYDVSILSSHLVWGRDPGASNATSLLFNGTALCNNPEGIFQTLLTANIACDDTYDVTAVWITYYATSILSLGNHTFVNTTSFSRNCQSNASSTIMMYQHPSHSALPSFSGEWNVTLFVNFAFDCRSGVCAQFSPAVDVNVSFQVQAIDSYLNLNESNLIADGPGERRYLLDLSPYEIVNASEPSMVWVQLYINGSDSALSEVDGDGAFFDYVNITGHQNVLLVQGQWVVFKTRAVNPLEIFFQRNPSADYVPMYVTVRVLTHAPPGAPIYRRHWFAPALICVAIFICVIAFTVASVGKRWRQEQYEELRDEGVNGDIAGKH